MSLIAADGPRDEEEEEAGKSKARFGSTLKSRTLKTTQHLWSAVRSRRKQHLPAQNKAQREEKCPETGGGKERALEVETV